MQIFANLTLPFLLLPRTHSPWKPPTPLHLTPGSFKTKSPSEILQAAFTFPLISKLCEGTVYPASRCLKVLGSWSGSGGSAEQGSVMVLFAWSACWFGVSMGKVCGLNADGLFVLFFIVWDNLCGLFVLFFLVWDNLCGLFLLFCPYVGCCLLLSPAFCRNIV